MTIMGFDVETIEHLDFDFAPPCEQVEDCDAVAEWKLVVSCCGAVVFMCTPHKEELMDMMVMGKLHHTGMGGCGTKDIDIIMVERLS